MTVSGSPHAPRHFATLLTHTDLVRLVRCALDAGPRQSSGLSAGEPAAVLQLLDRHNRDCAVVAERLGVPHLVAPALVPASPFEVVEVKRRKRWQEVALWWPEQRALVVAEEVGTNRFFTGGRSAVGVHLLLRLTPPKVLGSPEPEHLLVGHGEGLHGPETVAALREALRHSRRDLPRLLATLPFSARR